MSTDINEVNTRPSTCLLSHYPCCQNQSAPSQAMPDSAYLSPHNTGRGIQTRLVLIRAAKIRQNSKNPVSSCKIQGKASRPPLTTEKETQQKGDESQSYHERIQIVPAKHAKQPCKNPDKTGFAKIRYLRVLLQKRQTVLNSYRFPRSIAIFLFCRIFAAA